MAKMMNWDLGRMLVEAGVMTQQEVNETSRIVIDSGAGKDRQVKLYIERYADSEKMEKLVPMLKDLFRSDDD